MLTHAGDLLPHNLLFLKVIKWINPKYTSSQLGDISPKTLFSNWRGFYNVMRWMQRNGWKTRSRWPLMNKFNRTAAVLSEECVRDVNTHQWQNVCVCVCDTTEPHFLIPRDKQTRMHEETRSNKRDILQRDKNKSFKHLMTGDTWRKILDRPTGGEIPAG